MTEQEIINATTTSEANNDNKVASIEEIQSVQKEERKSTNRSTRKQSNLRGRWKRNQAAAGVATIKEDDAKLPKEIKTVKISTAESLNKPSKSNDYRKQRSERKPSKDAKIHASEARKEKCSEHKCICASFWGKVKCFVLKLFGFKPKKHCSSHKSNHYGCPRNKRPYRGRPRSK
ncbi:MAG: hypothetical protein ACLRFH_01800 [Opitutales bacterium]